MQQLTGTSSPSLLPASAHTVLFATAAGFTTVHAIRLSWSLFLEYLSSPILGGDVAEALCNRDTIGSFFGSGFNISALAETYARILGNRLVYRFVECGVSAACAFSPSPFFQGAVVFHYLYPTVQEYRFGRFWVTRVMRAVSSWIVPRFLRPRKISPEDDPEGAYLQSPPNPLSALGGGSSCRNTAPLPSSCGASKQAREDAFFSYQEAVFEAMPDVCAATLRYYVYSYKAAPFRTILQAAVIPDFSRYLVALGQAAFVFSEERKKQTSQWRLLKRFLASNASTLTQVWLSYLVRYTGVTVSAAVFPEPTGGAAFWTEHLLLLALGFPVLMAATMAEHAVFEQLDKKFPPTAEDAEEDQKERAEAEEATARSDGWSRMTSENIWGRGGGSNINSSDDNSNSSNAKFSAGSNGEMVDFYKILDISEAANDGEVKKAYRQLALRNHPDRVASDDAQAQRLARERMSVINEAYDTLMDGHKRRQYDTQRRMFKAPAFLDKLDNMSTPKLAGLTVGLCSLIGVAGYAQFVATFQRLTSSGCGPLAILTGE